MSRENQHFLSEDSFLNKLTFPSFFICDVFFFFYCSTVATLTATHGEQQSCYHGDSVHGPNLRINQRLTTVRNKNVVERFFLHLLRH